MATMANEDVKKMIDISVTTKAFRLMATAKSLTELYEENKAVCAKYVMKQFSWL